MIGEAVGWWRMQGDKGMERRVGGKVGGWGTRGSQTPFLVGPASWVTFRKATSNP